MWFSHPKPFIRRAVAMQMAEHKKLPPPDTTTITIEHEDMSIPELTRQAGTAADSAVPIRLSVTLQLREYLDFRWASNRSGKKRMRLPDTVAGALWYYLRVRNAAASAIDIDEQQITRSGAGGTSVWSWRDVREVRPNPTGYLVRLADTSMPIPYRLLSADQRARFRAMIRR
ncbi:YcxB family protein [Oxalobacteraceae bacterium OTU3CINTB1]|nr:YcxB family protein [Oxalobacteraceae bacterium OTU3CINTB1]